MFLVVAGKFCVTVLSELFTVLYEDSYDVNVLKYNDKVFVGPRMFFRNRETYS